MTAPPNLNPSRWASATIPFLHISALWAAIARADVSTIAAILVSLWRSALTALPYLLTESIAASIRPSRGR